MTTPYPPARLRHIKRWTRQDLQGIVAPQTWEHSAAMKNFLLQIFTWWNGQTLGTRFFTWRKGEFVGEDDSGNRYYREKNGNRRWVIYNGEADASKIPTGWHGWMHYRVDVAPSEEQYIPRRWQKAHRPNMTGTAQAYRPAGSILNSEHAPAEATDYKPWTPGD